MNFYGFLFSPVIYSNTISLNCFVKTLAWIWQISQIGWCLKILPKPKNILEKMSLVTFVTNSTPVTIHLANYCMILQTKISWLFPPKVSVEHHKDWEERVRLMVRSFSQLTIILTSLHFIVNLEFRIEFCKETISFLRLLPFLGQRRWLSFLRSQTHPIVMVSEWVSEGVSERDHWRSKYTEVQSQQMAFTQSPFIEQQS